VRAVQRLGRRLGGIISGGLVPDGATMSADVRNKKAPQRLRGPGHKGPFAQVLPCKECKHSSSDKIGLPILKFRPPWPRSPQKWCCHLIDLSTTAPSLAQSGLCHGERP
jgi:hypothetical protein